jgi:ferredoxin
MYRKGLIRARRGDAGLTFALMPFIVGIYEAQLKHMDAELARLFERYYQESRGVVADYPPAVHRVLPVEQAIPLSLEVFPYERASELVEEARSWGVRDCICRVQQHLVGKGCDGPVENCIVLAPVERAFDRSEMSRPITKADALRILQEAADAGMVHSTGNFRDRHYYICNCCACCCGILRAVAEFDKPAGVARSDFRAVVDADECAACGDCVSRCLFRALAIRDDACTVDAERCVGCGLCVSSCPTNALLLERRPEGQVPRPPANLKEWTAERARERGISLTELL